MAGVGGIALLGVRGVFSPAHESLEALVEINCNRFKSQPLPADNLSQCTWAAVLVSKGA
jgi:hypothetical protein